MNRRTFRIALLLLCSLAASPAAGSDSMTYAGDTMGTATIAFKDEGVSKGAASTINCVGAGITCSVSSGTKTATITVPGGSTVTYPVCAPGEVITSDGGLFCVGTVANASSTPLSGVTGVPSCGPSGFLTSPDGGVPQCAVPPGTYSLPPIGAASLGGVEGCTGTGCVSSPGLVCGTGYVLYGFNASGLEQCANDIANATTASSLASTTQCSAGQGATGISTGGAAQGCTTYVQTEVDPTVNSLGKATLNCIAGQVPMQADAGGWVCGYPTGGSGSPPNYPICAGGEVITSDGGLICTNTISNATTASSLASTTQCSAGQGATGISTGGAAQGCTTYLQSVPLAGPSAIGGIKGNGSTTTCASGGLMTGWDVVGAMTCTADGKRWPFTNVLTVDPTDALADYSTIQAAITAASAGTTILVGTGTYAETLTLKDGVDLFGLGYSDTGGYGVYVTKLLVVGNTDMITGQATGTSNISNMFFKLTTSTGGLTCSVLKLGNGSVFFYNSVLSLSASTGTGTHYTVTTDAASGIATFRHSQVTAANPLGTLANIAAVYSFTNGDVELFDTTVNMSANGSTLAAIYVNGGTVALDDVQVTANSAAGVYRNAGTVNVNGPYKSQGTAGDNNDADTSLGTSYAKLNLYPYALTDGSSSFYRVHHRANAADQASLTNGDIWYNSTSNTFRAYENGANVPLRYVPTALTASALGDVTGCTGTGCVSSPGLTCATGYYASGFNASGLLQCTLDPVITASTTGDVTGCTGVGCVSSPGLTCATGYRTTGFNASGVMQCGTIPTDISGASYWTKVAEASLSNEVALGALGTGLIINTTTTGVPTIYGGTTCTNQYPRSLNASGAATCAGVGVNDFNANQGTTTTLLHGNAAGQPSWTGVSLTADATANQGTTTTVLHGNGAGQPSFGSVVMGDFAAAGSGPHIVRVSGSNFTTTSASLSTITGLTWNTAASTTYQYRCFLNTTGTATGGPRFAVTNTGTITSQADQIFSETTSATTLSFLSTAASGTTTASCTSGCITAIPVSISGMLNEGAGTGTISIQASNSTAGQTTTVLIGSYCIWWTP